MLAPLSVRFQGQREVARALNFAAAMASDLPELEGSNDEDYLKGLFMGRFQGVLTSIFQIEKPAVILKVLRDKPHVWLTPDLKSGRFLEILSRGNEDPRTREPHWQHIESAIETFFTMCGHTALAIQPESARLAILSALKTCQQTLEKQLVAKSRARVVIAFPDRKR
ncbi:MAG: hypothetical protein IPK79_04465 [Vampirovibrionales bacterium]|nr:hypothetical protein [Vampirovibrionales bacterium]